MCDCIKKNEERVKSFFEKNIKFKDLNVEVDVDGKFLFVNNGQVGISTKFNAEATKITKSGKLRKVKDFENIIWNFCPFCGDKLMSNDSK